MSKRRRNTLWILGLATVAAFAGVWVWWRPTADPSPVDSRPPAAEIPLPPFSPSRYLNTGPDATFIGSAACAQCHQGQHQSYQLTEHSRALGEVDVDDEPPDQSFVHKASGRTYRVYRQGKTLRHEEILRTSEGKEIARVDHPVRYRVGSATRTYLTEIDGYLVESPITWYAQKKKWDMSPGYDMPNHQTFERTVPLQCLTCHAGRVEPVGDSVQRMTVHERAIGCESCHGPGSVHEKLHRSGKFVAGAEDLTIVHPGKLKRPLLEAICAHCHQTGVASVLVRGRQPGDFRPGQPLTDYRTDYQFTSDNEQMTVVGHLEQLRRSACYQKSPELTCLTCHDPHARAKPKDLTAHHRQQCLNCHTTKGCTLEEGERRRKNSADSCIACHMPRGDTDVPHVAFTHHRIGRHSTAPMPAPKDIPDLTPISEDVARLPPLDQKRNLGLAYLEVARNRNYAHMAKEYLQRSQALLKAVHAAGLRHDETAGALWQLHQETDPEEAVALARETQEGKNVADTERARARMSIALFELKQGNVEMAAGLLEKLTPMRRNADDWLLLGMVHLQQDQPNQAIPALQKALAIQPFRPAAYFGLEEAYRRIGDTRLANEAFAKGQWLSQQRQD